MINISVNGNKLGQADIERVKKAFLHIALGSKYQSYDSALEISMLATLESRRLQLCVRFAKRCAKHTKHKEWFKLNDTLPKTRSAKPNMKEALYRLARFRDSPIPYLTNILNSK